MTKVWARELGRYNVRVNAVAPGFTATEMIMAMPERILEGMKARTPLGRMAQPRDIANAALYFASDRSTYVTGQVLGVDGGGSAGDTINRNAMLIETRAAFDRGEIR